MKKQESTSHFKMSYAALMQLGDKAEMLIDRDAAVLVTYGVNNDMKTQIVNKTQALKDLPTDEELLAIVSLRTEEKNKHADELKTAIRNITVRAKNFYGEDSAKYKQYGVKGLDKMTDDELYRCAKRVVRTATADLSELSAKGLTQDEITELSNLMQTFDDIIDAKDQAIRERDIATEQRIEEGNDLYKLISEVFDYGKNYWYSREEAKYNDYIIYDRVSNHKKDIIRVPSGQKVSANIENVVNETVFEIENTGKAALSFYVADSLESETPENALLLDSKEVKIIKADDITNGSYGKLIAVNNNTEAEGSFYAEEVK